MPFADVSNNALAALAPSPELQTALGDAQLTINCATDTDEQPACKRISIGVSWPASGATRRSVHIVTWKYDEQGPRP